MKGIPDINEETSLNTYTYEKLPETMSIYPVNFETKSKVNEYLHDRFGDYMKLPPEEKRKEKVHAMMYDTEKDYSEYL